MEELLKILISSGPQNLGWVVAIGVGIQYIRLTYYSMGIISANTETITKFNGITEAIREIRIILDERLPKKSSR